MHILKNKFKISMGYENENIVSGEGERNQLLKEENVIHLLKRYIKILG